MRYIVLLIQFYLLPVFFFEGHVYGTRFSINNPFDKPITIRWNVNEDQIKDDDQQKRSWTTNSPLSYTIQPGTTKDILVRIRFTEQLPKNVDLMKSLLSLSATFEGVNNPMVMLDGKEKRPLEAYLEGVDDNGNRGNGNDNKPSKHSKVVAIKATSPKSKLTNAN